MPDSPDLESLLSASISTVTLWRGWRPTLLDQMIADEVYLGRARDCVGIDPEATPRPGLLLDGACLPLMLGGA